MIPILYDTNEREFTSNGLGRLTDCISCKVTEELNGVYSCLFTYPVTGRLFSSITLGRIIGVTHDDTGDLQPFDIISYSKPINGIVTFNAVHVSYRLTRYITKKGSETVDRISRAFTMFDNAAPRDGLFHYMAPGLPYNGYMASTADGIPRSVREFIGGVEGSFLDTYGGEITWDKFIVKFTPRRGQDRNFTIRYGVNLTDYNEEADGSGTYTWAVPYWTDGETTVVGSEVHSGLTPYDRTTVRALNFSDKFEEEPTTTQLEELAAQTMQANQTNLPKRTIDVDFVRLQDLEGYENYSTLLTCELGDSVGVTFPAYNVSGTFRIVKTVYNVLTNRFDAMTLGALSTTLAEALGVGQNAIKASVGGASKVRTYFYGTCATGGGTAAKVVTCPEFTANDLAAGAVIYVDFTNANTVASPTLNVNSTGAKAIRRYGSTAPSTSAASSWNAGATVCLIYDGTYWNIEGWINTTYSSMTVAEYQAGTGATARLITPARLKGAITYWINETIADYVTEEGTASGWKYRKWNSGYIEAWYSGSITFSAAGTSIAGWYRSVENISLPSNLVFADDAVVQVTGAYSGRIFTSGGIKTNGTQFEAQILGATAMGAGAVSGWNVYIAGQARS